MYRKWLDYMFTAAILIAVLAIGFKVLRDVSTEERARQWRHELCTQRGGVLVQSDDGYVCIDKKAVK